MADPRFYDNRGPFSLAVVCARASVAVPGGANPESRIADLASLSGAGPQHLTFRTGKKNVAVFAELQAAYCLIEAGASISAATLQTNLIQCSSVLHAFAAVARLFYPEHELGRWTQDEPIHPTAKLEENVHLAPGVVIGASAEIGTGTAIGPHAVIGRGVTIGRNCQIGSHAGI